MSSRNLVNFTTSGKCNLAGDPSFRVPSSAFRMLAETLPNSKASKKYAIWLGVVLISSCYLLSNEE